MAALDTNVLVRFVVQDHPAQGAVAARLLREAIESQETLFVPVTVTLELEWVLRSVFRFDRAATQQALLRLLGSFELEFESEGAVETAIHNCDRTSADFADCLHAALALSAARQPLWTFDKTAAKVQGAALLT